MEVNCGQEEKRSGLECGQAEVEGGELVLLKLQGASSGQVDRRALRATGLGNTHSQGHTIREMETGPARSLCCDALRLSLVFFLIGRVRVIAKGDY